MDPAAASSESFSFFNLFLQADWVVKGVMLGLGFASLWSWAVIIDKTVRFTGLNREADRFEEAVSNGRSLEEVANEAGTTPRHPLIQRVDRVLDSMIARESSKVEDGLGSLAIVATASPFIGLFGTVWGIMHAFQNIAIQKNTSLAVVAPSIAEALFATAVGLIAAIPAYIAYNKFSTDAGKFAGRLEGFADDLSTAIQRRVADKA